MGVNKTRISSIMIVTTDPAINGDMLCMELLGKTTTTCQYVLLSMWILVIMLIITLNRQVKRRVGGANSTIIL